MSCDDCDRDEDLHIRVTEPGEEPQPRPGTPRVSLTIDLPALDPEEIRQEVIAYIVQRYVVGETTSIREHGFPGRVGETYEIRGWQALNDVIRDGVTKEVRKLIQPHLHEILTAQVQEVLESRVQRTNSWGEPSGDPVSIRDLIRSTLESFVTERVTSDGRADRSGRTRAEWVVAKEASTIMAKVIDPEIKKAVAELREQVADQATSHIREAVRGFLKL